MKNVLVDSNVILDIVTEDANWFEWSSNKVSECAKQNILGINSIIYAEVSIGFERIEELEAALPISFFRRFDLPWEAAFLAGIFGNIAKEVGINALLYLIFTLALMLS